MFPYDIHPILVHIPIAFLSIYALVEIFTIIFLSKKWIETIWLRMFLLLVGILGAQGSLMSGEVASDLKRGEISRNLVEMHESFASISSGIFLGIFIAYLFVLLVIYSKVYEKINIYLERKSVFLVKVLKIKKALGDFLIKNKFLFLIAGLAGFITITITGALGGALVYGKDADPFISITLKILNLY